MNNNYHRMQEFLDMMREFAISNPNRVITSDFVYSNLIRFGINSTQSPSESIKENFDYWKTRYRFNKNINVFETDILKNFCFFANGEIKGNEVKLYIPLDKNHIKNGANQLFDFIASTGIEHQSKIATIIRNDNVVVRVNSLEDAQTIIQYVNSNAYIREGMLNVNPFLPNCNGVGITMDNNFSFNSELSKIISNFIELLKNNNRLDLFTVEELNKYITNSISSIYNLDLKDIYSLLSKTTSRNFKLQDFYNHANNKLIDKYDDRERIVEPIYYLQNAIKVTEKYYPGNSKTAILQYLNSVSNYFTNKEKARVGLLKYVKPSDVIPLMRKVLQERNMAIPHSDEQLVEQFLNIVLNKQNNYYEQFEIIKRAYTNTFNVYGEGQAAAAFRDLFVNDGVKYFTNRFNDRTDLKNNVIPYGAKRIILSNINIEGIDPHNVSDVLLRFMQTLSKGSLRINSY